MWLFILLFIVIFLCWSSSGSAEASKAEIRKMARLLTHYKLNATEYLQKKFNVTGQKLNLIKNICRKFSINTYAQFVELSEICQRNLLPPDKLQFLNENSYVPSESEYAIIEKLIHRENAYEFWRTHKCFKIRDKFLKLPLEKLKQQQEPFEIDVVPFHAYSDENYLEKENKLLTSMLKRVNQQLKYKIMMALIRNQQLKSGADSDLILQHLKEVESLVKQANANGVKYELPDENLISKDIANIKEIIEREKNDEALNDLLLEKEKLLMSAHGGLNPEELSVLSALMDSDVSLAEFQNAMLLLKQMEAAEKSQSQPPITFDGDVPKKSIPEPVIIDDPPSSPPLPDSLFQPPDIENAPLDDSKGKAELGSHEFSVYGFYERIRRDF
jgi:hypothetical protein